MALFKSSDYPSQPKPGPVKLVKQLLNPGRKTSRPGFKRKG